MKYFIPAILALTASIFIYSCGEKIARPEEITFGGATVFVDQAVFWGYSDSSLGNVQLLANGDMEEWPDTTEAGPPVYWTVPTGFITANREPGNYLDGEYSAVLTWTSEDDQFFLSEPIPVQAESVYTCSLYVYDNDEGGLAQVVMFWSTGAKAEQAKSSNSPEWQLLTASATAPQGASSVRVGLKLQDMVEGLSDTVFIQLNPPWDSDRGYSFSSPCKIIVGRDTYLYVCDTGNDRIVRLDAAGTEYGSYSVPNPIGVTQNELLHLLVVNGTRNIYKIDVGPNGDGQAVVCFSGNRPKADSMLTDNFIFTDISDLPSFDKTYLACGYDSLIDGTGQVYIFMGSAGLDENSDTLLNSRFPTAGADPDAPDTANNPIVDYGTGVSYTDHPNGITSFARSGRLYLMITQDSSSFKTQLLEWYTNSYYHVAFFQAAILPGSGNDLYSDQYRGLIPNGGTIDSAGNLYTVISPDTALGIETYGAYKFDPSGQLKEKWGRFGSSTGEMNFPRGIAYDNFADRRTVYVCDTGNNRILRFKLSTDIGN